MESTVSAVLSQTLTHSSSPFVSRFSLHLSKADHLSQRLRTAQLLLSLRIRCARNETEPRRSRDFASVNSFRSLCAAVPSAVSRLDCISSSAAPFASGGGGGGVGGGSDGGGGGDGGSEGGDVKSKSVARGEGEEVAALPQDVIILDVGVRIPISFCLSFYLSSLYMYACIHMNTICSLIVLPT